MSFITPAGAVIFSSLLSAGTSLFQAAEASDQRKQQRQASETAAAEELRKQQLLESRSNRVRQRLASGSGSGTILSGGPQPEIGKATLLGG